MKKPAVYTQPSSSTITNFDFDGVTGALAQHEQGDLSRSAHLADAVQRDDRIHGDLRTLVRHFCALPLSITEAPNASDKAGARRARDLLAEVMPIILPTGVLPSVVRDLALLGTSFGQELWTDAVVGGTKLWINPFSHWHASAATWDDTAHVWNLSTTTGRVTVPPRPEETAPGFACLRVEDSRPFLAGIIRALGFLQLWRAWSSRDFARFNERHAIPPLLFSEPAFLDAEAKKAFYGKIGRIGSEAAIRLPRNAAGDVMTMELLEVSGVPTTTFEAWRASLDTGISILIRGSNLPTQVDGGSFSAAQVQNDVNDLILQGLSTAISATVLEQLAKPFLRLNCSGYSDAICPVIAWRAEKTMSAQDVMGLVGGRVLTVDEGRSLLGFAPLPKDTRSTADRALAALASGTVDGANVIRLGGPETVRRLRANASPQEGRALLLAEVAARALARGDR